MNILTVVPIKPSMNVVLKNKITEYVCKLPENNLDYKIETLIWTKSESSNPSDYTPWSKVSRIRNSIIEHLISENKLSSYDYIFWIDADVVEAPLDLPTKLISSNPTGPSAPMVFIEDLGAFYDTRGFILHDTSQINPTNIDLIPGRNLSGTGNCGLPENSVVDLDVVGTCYTVPTSVYLSGVRHYDHPAFTDHFSICEWFKNNGSRVTVNTGISIYHANLPKYGEDWH